MTLPPNLQPDKVPEETAVVCPTSVEDWCVQYVDNGRCAREWAVLHATALTFLEKHEPSGTSHGFAGFGMLDEFGV